MLVGSSSETLTDSMVEEASVVAGVVSIAVDLAVEVRTVIVMLPLADTSPQLAAPSDVAEQADPLAVWKKDVNSD